MFIDWILKGENPAMVPMVFHARRNVSSMHDVGSVNVVIRESVNYYACAGGKATNIKVSPETAQCFFDFEKSGIFVWGNIHAANDPHYPNQTFINRWIDMDGKFLGIASTGMGGEDFNRELTSMRIGEHGAYGPRCS